jgi:choline dehydrogenase-like flavoprotein
VLERWSREFGLDLDEASLRPCFERVEQALSISEVTPELAGNNAAVARRGAERLGWSHGYLRRNAKGCVGSGVCAFGCPTSAKQHTGITYLPRARAAGAQIVTGADARTIIVRRGRAVGVEARVPGAGWLSVSSPLVIVAAGTVHTPLLLARNGLGRGSGELGRNLSLHPATAAFALMDEVVDMARGVPQSFYVDEFADEGVMFEGVAGPPAYAAMSLPLTGSRHAAAMASYRHLAQFGLMVSDSSRGRVHAVAGRPVIRYDLTPHDLARFRLGLARLEELLLAADAREVYLPLPPGVRPERARAHDLRLMAFHPLGTARADARPTHGVVDGDLELHGVSGLYVADGAVVPSALGVNPQLTIMALATRLAFRLLGERALSRTPTKEVLCHS